MHHSKWYWRKIDEELAWEEKVPAEGEPQPGYWPADDPAPQAVPEPEAAAD